MDEKARKILSRLEGQCSKREYCYSDIYRKALEKCEGEVEKAEEIVASLVENKFVDDLRYASAFAREKASLSAWGPIKIAYALSAKKIDRDTIEQALSEIENDKAEQRLEKLLENKRRSLDGDPQARLKLIRFALSRGYDYDTIKKFIN